MAEQKFLFEQPKVTKRVRVSVIDVESVFSFNAFGTTANAVMGAIQSALSIPAAAVSSRAKASRKRK